MRLLLFGSIVSMVASFLFAGHWPQFRGPAYNGTCNETNLPDQLDPNSVLWKTRLPGAGESTPAIHGDRIYLTGCEKENKALFVMCLDAADGTIRWKKNVSRYVKPKRGTTVAGNSPAADASGAVFLFSNGYLVKFDPDGKQLWDYDLVEKYGPMSHLWNYSNSPMLHGGKLYVTVMRMDPMHDGPPVDRPLASYLLGLDPATGKMLFKTDRPTDAVFESKDAYTTPVIAEVNGKQQIVLYGADHITGHDPDSGAELWRHHFSIKKQRMDRAIATPVVHGDKLYCSYPRGEFFVAFSLSKLAAADPVPIAWTHEATAPDVPSPVVMDGCVYFIAEKKKTLTCLDAATGTKHWTGQLDKGAVYQASITGADGKLYMVNRDGVVSVVAADRSAFRLLGSCDFGENPSDSSIAIAGGKCYLRTAENLYCFGKKP